MLALAFVAASVAGLDPAEHETSSLDMWLFDMGELARMVLDLLGFTSAKLR